MIDYGKNIKKVSVVLCTYNGEKYLKEQLDTIINQDYPVFELIIQDDCSTDTTMDILKEYQQKYSVIKLYQNEKNIGFVQNFLTASLKSTGDYIAFSDQDDIWMSNKISVMIGAIDKNKLVISQCKLLYVSDGSSSLSYVANNPHTLNIFKITVCGTSYSGNQFLFDKSLLYYFDIARDLGVDHVSFVLICALFLESVVCVDDVLQIWRRHENNFTKEFKYRKLKNNNRGRKVLFCMKELLLNHKSNQIYQGCGKRYELLYALCSRHKVFSQRHRQLLTLVKLMQQQRFLGYIRASFLCYKLRKEIFQYNNYNIRNLMQVFSYVYKHWYNFHLNFY